jgi:hypothetical protein
MLNTERLDSLTNGNLDLIRCTLSGAIQLIGTGRSRLHGLKEAGNPDKQRYECCQ